MSDEIIILTKRPATIKNALKIDFEMEERTPITSRENPKFNTYFDMVWKELNGSA